MEKEINPIIQELVAVRGENKLNISDECLFDNAIKIFISNNIQKSNSFAKSSQVGSSAPKKESAEVIKGADKPTTKQLKILSRFLKKDILDKLNKREATQMLSEYFAKLSEEKK